MRFHKSTDDNMSYYFTYNNDDYKVEIKKIGKNVIQSTIYKYGNCITKQSNYYDRISDECIAEEIVKYIKRENSIENIWKYVSTKLELE